MKKTLTKFLALLGVFILLGAGNALAQTAEPYNLYLRCDQFDNWNETSYRNKLTKVSDTEYYIYMPYLWGDFKISGPNLGDHGGWGYVVDVNSNNTTMVSHITKGDKDNLHCEIGNTCKITLKITGNKQYSVEAEPVLPLYRLWGQFESGDWKEQQFVPIGDNLWERVIKITANNGTGEFGIEKMKHNGGNEYGNGQYSQESWVGFSGTISVSNRSLSAGSGSPNANFSLKKDCYYTFRFDAEKKILTLWKPDELFLVGNINNLAYLPDNTYQMDKTDDGVFVLKSMELTASPGDPNYAYFDFCCATSPDLGINVPESEYQNYPELLARLDAGWDYVAPRFGSMFNDHEVNSTTKSVNDMQQFTTNSFKIKPGCYDITVNFNDMTVTIEPAERLRFDWHDHNREIIEDRVDNVNYVHETTIDLDNTVEVGVGGEADHEAAQKVKYSVLYMPLTTYNVFAAENSYVTGKENEHYSIDGNNAITLLQAGQYQITAEDRFHSLANTTLSVTVNPQTLASVGNNSLTQIFKNNKNTLAITLTESQISSEDIIVSFTPVEEDGNPWPTDYSELPEDLQGEVNSLQGNQFIDGIYKEITSDDYKVNGSNGNFTIEVAFPCSGVYTMTLSSTNANYVLNEEYTVTIYPTVMNYYNQTITTTQGTQIKETSLNVNGIPYTKGGSDGFAGTINYPIIDGNLSWAGKLENSLIYTVGLYFADIEIYSYPGSNVAEGNESDTELTDNYTPYKIFDAFNLSSLSSNQPVALYVYVSKNGAKAPILNGNSEENFLIKTTTDSSLIPTGVEAIGAEESEAVYYNLQGVRVENPQHGIYVKVVNGQATKVVL